MTRFEACFDELPDLADPFCRLRSVRSEGGSLPNHVTHKTKRLPERLATAGMMKEH